MSIKTLAFTALMLSTFAASANTISVNVSMPGASNPYYGYQMSYTDDKRNSCLFRFKYSEDGLAYLVSDKECPSFVTEDRVRNDARNSLDEMSIVSSADNFFEYLGNDGYGNSTERAPLNYRCVGISDINIPDLTQWVGISRRGGYVLMPITDTYMDGWFEMDFLLDGVYLEKVGVWKLDEDWNIIGIDRGRQFTVDSSKVSYECPLRRFH